MALKAKKIPIYESRRSPSGRFARPRLPDFSDDIARTLVTASHEVLDAKAKSEGYEAGIKRQQETLKEGMDYVNAENDWTIAGGAFKKGANAAYIAGTKKKFDKDIRELRKKYDGTTLENPIPDLDTFNSEAEHLRQDYVSNMPSHLQPDLTQYLDGTIESNINYVTGEKDKWEKGQAIDTIASAVLESITTIENEVTLLGISETAITTYGEVIAQIESLEGTLSPSKATQLKNELFTRIKYAAVRFGYNGATNKEEFIESVRDGTEQYQEVMQEVHDVLLEAGHDVGITLTIKEQIALSNELYSSYNFDKRNMSVGFDVESKNLDNAIKLEAKGIDSGYEFSEEKFAGFGISVDDIAILKDEWDDAQVEGGFVKKLQTISVTEHAQEVLNITKQIDIYESQLSTGLTQDGPAGAVRELNDVELAVIRDDLLMWQGIEKSVTEDLLAKQTLIQKADGSEWALVTNAGHTLDFSTPEKIDEMHVL